MIKSKITLAFDVSKQSLDYAIYSDGIVAEGQIQNKLKKIEGFLSRYEISEVLVVFEATGTYSDKLLCCLEEGGFKFSIVNPRQSHYYSLSKGISSKTDKQAARMLAELGAKEYLPLYIPSSASNKKRKQIMQAISTLNKDKQRIRNRIHALEQYKTPVESVMNAYTTQLESLEKLIQELKKGLKGLKDEKYTEQKVLVKTIAGIGEVTASWLLTYTNGLTNFHNAKQLIKFLGLAPRTQSSGSSVYIKRGMTKTGKGKIRACLYMAAISSIKFNNACRELYYRLRKSKPHFKAMVAVMCKLLKQIFAVVKSEKPFDNNYYLKFIKE